METMFLAASFMSWTLPDCGGKRTNFVVMSELRAPRKTDTKHGKKCATSKAVDDATRFVICAKLITNDGAWERNLMRRSVSNAEGTADVYMANIGW